MGVSQNETIVAISTPPGRGGIGVVRLSGPGALDVALAMMQLEGELEHARARVARLVDEDEMPVDEVVVTAFLAPRSYTGEDLVEISAHGAPVVLEWIVRRALALGFGAVRVAEPGEFSRRAFLSGRMDLTQAEAIHDLIAAQTMAQARTAAQQMGGALSRRVAPIKASLVYVIAMLEAGMDFASGELDDVDTMPPARIADQLRQVTEPLRALAATFRAASLERSGARLAIVGRPNAGKSSLFNRLLERDRAIVTPVAGTTRDTIEEAMALDGIPVRLVDTAGLRFDSVDEAEAMGIARSREALADADLVVVVRDAAADAEQEALPAEVEELLRDRMVIRVRNKVDLQPGAGAAGEIGTSAVTGEGLAELRAAMLGHLRDGQAGAEDGVLNNLRQHHAVAHALQAVETATLANANHLPHEMLLMDLHAALKSLDELTGQTTTDDLLGLIFSTFCIGK